MYFTDRGIEELEARRGEEDIAVAWLAERLRDFVNLNPSFETAIDRLAVYLARSDDEEVDLLRHNYGGAPPPIAFVPWPRADDGPVARRPLSARGVGRRQRRPQACGHQPKPQPTTVRLGPSRLISHIGPTGRSDATGRARAREPFHPLAGPFTL
jgi:hypothetical protein